MKLTEIIEAKCYVYDLETLIECFMAGFLEIDTGEYIQFEISKNRNDLYKLIKWYDNKNFDYLIGYNNLGFDAQVMEYIRMSYENWYDLTNLEICERIYKFVQNLIEGQKYHQRLPFYENQFYVKQLDVFTMLSLKNEQRFTSLKAAEFALDMESVEEMPIHHSRRNLTQDEIELISGYMINDIKATKIVFLLALGITDHPHYHGNNQLALRFDIREEFKINCLSYSDIEIGEELMKVSYAKAIKKHVRDLPRKGTFRKAVRLKECIPEYVTFKTPYLQKFLDNLKKQKINQLDKFEREVKIGGRGYTLAKGGLHADQKDEIWEAIGDYLIEDDDVASYYPKILLNNGYYPAHLGIELLKTYKTIYERRIALKPLSKTDKKIKGVVEALKLSLNSVFGKMGAPDSWLFDMKAMFSITITGELTLLMLIERFEMNGINVISANSDGVTTLFHKDKKELKDQIVREWQKETNFEIETVKFKKFFYRDVNNYLAIKEDGEIKEKGIFVVNPEIYKNKSMRVRTLALKEYFVNGISPIKSISSHKNIYDFCVRAKATGDNYLELAYPDGRREHSGKLVRYYITNDKKEAPELFKRGIGTTGKPLNVNQQAPNDIGRVAIEYFNQFKEEKYDVNYPQYIYQTLKIIAGIEHNHKDNDYIKSLGPNNQLNLL